MWELRLVLMIYMNVKSMVMGLIVVIWIGRAHVKIRMVLMEDVIGMRTSIILIEELKQKLMERELRYTLKPIQINIVMNMVIIVLGQDQVVVFMIEEEIVDKFMILKKLETKVGVHVLMAIMFIKLKCQ